jgi:hypothetical protein
MFVTRISRCIQRSVVSAVSRNRSRSGNVLSTNGGTPDYINRSVYTIIKQNKQMYIQGDQKVHVHLAITDKHAKIF